MTSHYPVEASLPNEDRKDKTLDVLDPMKPFGDLFCKYKVDVYVGAHYHVY